MIGRICRREVYLAEPGESAQQAAQRMRDRAVGTLLVLNKTGAPAGILTDRDLVVRVMAAGRDPRSTKVGDVMTTELRTAEESTAIDAVLAEMRAGHFRRMPVVDRDHALVGLATLDDIVGLLAEEMQDVARLLERQSPREPEEPPTD